MKNIKVNKIKTDNKYHMTRCNDCGELVPYGQYCNACGSALPHISLLKLTMVCKACERVVPKGEFCTRCGTKQD